MILPLVLAVELIIFFLQCRDQLGRIRTYFLAQVLMTAIYLPMGYVQYYEGTYDCDLKFCNYPHCALTGR